MPKTYATKTELANLVRDQINLIKGLASDFSPVDADLALEEAERDCGFDFPDVSDPDVQRKYKWLINRMRRWFIGRLWEQYTLQFNAGDIQTADIVRNFAKLCEDLDKQFVAAVEMDGDLFRDATMFGLTPIVVIPGLAEDRVGQSVEPRT